MKINGKEFGMFYSTGAHCAWNNYLVANPNVGVSEATVMRAVFMHDAYNKANGIKESNPVTKEAIMKLPYSVLQELEKAVDEQVKKDSLVTVETEEPKGKNGKSAAK